MQGLDCDCSENSLWGHWYVLIDACEWDWRAYQLDICLKSSIVAIDVHCVIVCDRSEDRTSIIAYALNVFLPDGSQSTAWQGIGWPARSASYKHCSKNCICYWRAIDTFESSGRHAHLQFTTSTQFSLELVSGWTNLRAKVFPSIPFLPIDSNFLLVTLCLWREMKFTVRSIPTFLMQADWDFELTDNLLT